MMRFFLFALIFTISVLFSYAHPPSVSINNSGKAPDSSAMLDVSSNAKGVLISRMATEKRLAIRKPAIGLMVYDTTVNCLCIYSGARWKLLCEDLNLNEGLLAYYKFDGNFGDSSGNNLHAASFGNPFFGLDRKGSNNGALVFDGSDDFLLVDDNDILNVLQFLFLYGLKQV